MESKATKVESLVRVLYLGYRSLPVMTQQNLDTGQFPPVAIGWGTKYSTPNIVPPHLGKGWTTNVKGLTSGMTHTSPFVYQSTHEETMKGKGTSGLLTRQWSRCYPGRASNDKMIMLPRSVGSLRAFWRSEGKNQDLGLSIGWKIRAHLGASNGGGCWSIW
jgi:hypothetical protein